MPASRLPGRDPYAGAPVGELEEPLLPRWFVLLAAVMVVAAVVVLVLAFALSGGEAPPVAARRPPPAAGYSHDVGEVLLGGSEPVPFEGACAEVDGLAVAGTERDRALLRRALASLCNVELEPEASRALVALAERGAVVRFAAFEATGVDSTVALGAEPPLVLVNARFAQAGRPGWVAPLLPHDAVTVAGDPASARTALAARRAQAAVCERLLGADDGSRGCRDARELLALDDPLAALREAGYR